MKLEIAVVMMVGACGGGGGRTEHYAVGATDYYASPNKCSIVDNAAGAVVELADHYQAKDGKGVVFQTVKPGTAKVQCGDDKATLVVTEVAKVELQRVDAATTPAALGTYAPTICLIAFAKDGTRLELGTLVDGVDFQFSEHMSRVVDHGMGGAGSAACGAQQWTNKAGIATVTATWRGHSAKAELEIQPKAL
jgi:hypothetical protein